MVQARFRRTIRLNPLWRASRPLKFRASKCLRRIKHSLTLKHRRLGTLRDVLFRQDTAPLLVQNMAMLFQAVTEPFSVLTRSKCLRHDKLVLPSNDVILDEVHTYDGML